MLRPVAEHMCVVFHLGLTDEQDEHLEKLHNQALKCIYGPFKSTRKMRAESGLPSLRERRVTLFCKGTLFRGKGGPPVLE